MVRLAKTEDVHEIMAMIGDAKAELRQKGVDQWQDGYPDEAQIRKDIGNHESYVVIPDDKEDGNLAGTAMISLRKEKTYERMASGQWLTGAKGRYAVIHRITTSKTYKHKGAAAQLLMYAEALCRDHRAESIRIDTHQDNLTMQTWLEKHGFIYCGVIYLEDGAPRLAYEKKLHLFT